MAFFSIESIGRQSKRRYYSSMSKPFEVDTYPCVGISPSVFMLAKQAILANYALAGIHEARRISLDDKAAFVFGSPVEVETQAAMIRERYLADALDECHRPVQISVDTRTQESLRAYRNTNLRHINIHS